MKIAVRCIYHFPITPNFLIVDLPNEEWQEFLCKQSSRIGIIRKYLTSPGPSISSIREIAWIPLEGLSAKERELFYETLNLSNETI